ncbi:MAG: protein-disulfide reductase DsbD N-terminal domain-containing protein [Acidobacteriia bacterium]|nr:protein-disulfide reductase DsbD N-terminal domain-containing protein [Terriglobia bacterium]
MIPRRGVLRLALAALLALLGLLCPPRGAAQLPSAREVVAPAAYVSLQPVPRGRAFQLAVVLKIRPGFHINAREASMDYLIPTDLQAAVPAGFHAGAVTYPKGALRKFSFSPEKPLNVYQGTAVLRISLSALPSAPLGAQRIPLKLRYQACSDEICLPPVTVALDAELHVAAAGAAAKPVHSELFLP